VKTNIHYLVVLDGIYTFSVLRWLENLWKPDSHSVTPRNAVLLNKVVLFFNGTAEKDRHYKIKDGHMPENPFPGEKCFRNRPIFDKDKILLPPLHIKLGLMKSSLKL
jgi:hypothetical protein